MKNLTELFSIEELDRAINESQRKVVLLFKHSLTCPISSRAFREFESFLAYADLRADYNLITIQTSRSVSNEAAARLNTPHESPQALLVSHGRTVWSASHFEITESSLSDAVRAALSEQDSQGG